MQSEIYPAEKLKEGMVLPFDKPLGWTSFYLVNKVRYWLCRHAGIKKLKVGHAGTLDPLATGLLILCTGKATKSIIEIQAQPKEYIAEITFGATTPSFDLETETDAEYPTDHLNEAMIVDCMISFEGKIMQVPPLFSAKMVKGVRAYTLAREGVEKELTPNEVEIHAFELLSFSNNKLAARIACSKGTYIRSLARDLGRKAGSGAHLSALRRTRIGEYSVDEAEIIENFKRKLNFL